MNQGAASIDHLAGVENDTLRAFQYLLAAIREAEKNAVLQMPSTPASAGDAESGNTEAQATKVARDILLPAFEVFGRRMNDLLPNTGQDPARQATYAAAAFIDERMIGLAWPGRRDWMNRPFELQFFGSRSGGQDVFRQIDELDASGGSMTERALALVYLSILDLGFAGQYDPEQDRRQLSVYRRFLFKRVMGQDPDVETAGMRLTDPGAPPQQEGAVRYLPYLRPWIAAGVGLVLLFFAASHVIWLTRTQSLSDEVGRITEEMGY